MTLLALIIGLLGIIAYTLLYTLKKREIPNLGVLFLIFLAGTAVDEALNISLIFKQHLIDKVYVNFGDIENHQTVIAFGAIALLWVAITTYLTLFESIFDDAE